MIAEVSIQTETSHALLTVGVMLCPLMVLSFSLILAMPVDSNRMPAPRSERAWVFFRDKPSDSQRMVWPSPRDLHPTSALDLDLDQRYVQAVEETGVTVRFLSRWFNAVSVIATPEQQVKLNELPFVRETAYIRQLLKSPKPDRPVDDHVKTKPTTNDYGLGFDQLSDIGVIALHNEGFSGEGVRIAVLDAGFPYLDHIAFKHLKVVAQRNFLNEVDEDGSADLEKETISRDNIHGTQVLSVLAAFDPGSMVGVAPHAEYLLATTEDTKNELPIDEDRWIAGLEWADSLGADIVNTSVGWNEFEDGSGYTYTDLDGRSALSTIAAEIAIARGIVVVVAAGNEAEEKWHYVTVPADGPNVITVGAVKLGRPIIAPFSSRGPTADGRIKPDVVAPGVSIVVVSAAVSSEKYTVNNGTSFAAPLVSGVAALLKQVHPNWSPNEIASALKKTTHDLGESGPDTTYGWGLVNALAASGIQVFVPERSLVSLPFPNPLSFKDDWRRGLRPTVYFPLLLDVEKLVNIDIYTVDGTLVYEFSGRLEAGDYTRRECALSWEVPTHLASGVYFYRMYGLEVLRTGKIALIR